MTPNVLITYFNICNTYLLGKASELHPMERIEHSTALIDLAGGSENMLNKMKQAYDEGKFQWALELADACIDTNNCVSDAKVKC